MSGADNATLNDGRTIPMLGLGTSRLEGAYDAVKSALKLGYRHIDTAASYGNEAEVGRAVRDSGIARDELFITTKLANDGHGDVEAELKASLQRLGLDYIDLYLIHWPMPGRVASWQTLEKLMEKQALIKSLGVSNFTKRHLEELLKVAKITPAVNQVELHPFVYQADFIQYVQKQGIQLVAYSPMTRGHKLEHPVVADIAAQTGKTPSQVLLRWNIQHEVVVIPKATSAKHQRANMDIFGWELTSEQMRRLDGLYDGFRVTEDPEVYP